MKRKNESRNKDLSLYRENETDVISWVDNVEVIGERLFTFDGVKIYNLFADYPHNLSKRFSTEKTPIGVTSSKTETLD